MRLSVRGEFALHNEDMYASMEAWVRGEGGISRGRMGRYGGWREGVGRLIYL
jgi:hypothetical protein